METPIRYKLLTPGAVPPVKMSPGASGWDLHYTGPDVRLWAGSIVRAPTGLAFDIPRGWEGQIRARSSMAERGVFVPNSPGTIDSDYRGEVCILLMMLMNMGEPYLIKGGQRIAQLVFARVETGVLCCTTELSVSNRGAGGFGSTGL